MSEKRFEVINARWEGKGEAVAFEDTQTNQVYFAENQEECERIVDLLNEQLSIIRRDEVSMKTMMSNIEKLEKENEQLKIANARWLDKSLQDKQTRYINANYQELTKKYLQLKEENEQLKKARDESDKFIVKKGLEIEFLNWCVENE